MRPPPRLWLVVLVACGCALACAPGGVEPAATQTGGSPGTAGAGGIGGAPAGSGGASPASTGGAIGTGGRAAGSGGAPTGSGGAPSGTGGMTAGSGGSPGTGGTGGAMSGSGGRLGSGGASGGAGGRASSGGSSGAAGAGGAAGLGGAAGTAGTRPYKGVANSACADMTRLKSSWFYNWTLSPGGCTTAEFVPMVSGKNEKTASAVTNALNQVANAGYKTVLGFNEPNKVDQSNLTVAQVLALWPQLTANPAIRVGSPATSADAQAWFNDFMTQATAQNLRVDFIAIHWYGWNAGSCDAKALTLENYIKWAEAIPGNRPIWITEWGCMNLSNPDAATVQAFYSGAIAMFERHPRIERYAWYPWLANNELVATGGALTPLGTTFAAAPATK